MSIIFMVVFSSQPLYFNFMSMIFFALMLVAMLLTVGSLGAGMVVSARGGEVSKKYSNKLMWARVYLQGAAIVFFLLAIATSQS